MGRVLYTRIQNYRHSVSFLHLAGVCSKKGRPTHRTVYAGSGVMTFPSMGDVSMKRLDVIAVMSAHVVYRSNRPGYEYTASIYLTPSGLHCGQGELMIPPKDRSMTVVAAPTSDITFAVPDRRYNLSQSLTELFPGTSTSGRGDAVATPGQHEIPLELLQCQLRIVDSRIRVKSIRKIGPQGSRAYWCHSPNVAMLHPLLRQKSILDFLRCFAHDQLATLERTVSARRRQICLTCDGGHLGSYPPDPYLSLLYDANVLDNGQRHQLCRKSRFSHPI
jgi:hypothetical protein